MSVTAWEVLADSFLIIKDHRTPNTRLIKQEPEPQQMIDTTELPEPEPVREEQVELWLLQDEGQLLVKRETSSSVGTPEYPGPKLQLMKGWTEDPELVQIKQEQEDLCSNQGDEQLLVKQEAESFTVTPNNELKDNSQLEPSQDRLLSEPETPHRTVNVDSSKLNAVKTNAPSCDVCGKVFTTFKYLTDHTRTHTGEKPYPCEFCGKCFTDCSTRAKHMKTHTGEKPYGCQVCGKAFGHCSNLARHMRTHTGEKPYSCRACGKSFRHCNTMARHMRTHTGEKPYSCEACEKSFIQPSDLARHLRSHTGEKAFSCLTCGKGFTRQSSLGVHMRTHTGEKPYPCKTCGKSFRYSSHLSRHENAHR
ncbi:gastrula zinc finger protein XlCGF17.1-like [Cyprinodon tularosa]|uniref:gastrula zinc finger protein XlCGF17.1-like n=1 Tax=Cyprinodon tularosa TaxID=77115 RepID=UPI0018E20924|nr:gastrula zinc finger protein XlCGF17.1-like [Cyprinodon tularosa]